MSLSGSLRASLRTRLACVVGFVASGCLLVCATAGATKAIDQYLAAAGPSGAAAPWAMISLGNFTANGPGTNNGNVVVASGKATISSPFRINGKLFLGQGVSYSSNVTPSGGVGSSPPLVSEAASAARMASKEFDGLSPTQTFGTLREGMTITASSSFNVIDATAVNMTDGTLTLAGNSSSVFIINVSGNFTSSNSDIALSGGVLASNIVWNIGGNLTITGGGQEHFFGTALAVNGQANVHDKLWEGEIIAREITDTSGFRVNSFPPAPPTPDFDIEKLQRISGAFGEFTKSALTGEVGQTIDYEILVKDTGNTQLTLSSFTDANCETIQGGPSKALLSGERATYTCQHLITIADQRAGSRSNTATVTATPVRGQGSASTHISNTVVVNIPTPTEPAFSIEKLQKIEGSSGSFTSSPLSASMGQTVDYEIVVKDTGNTSLTFSSFKDAGCEGIEGGPSEALAPGESATYACHHTPTGVGSYENNATVTGSPPEGEGPPIAHTSNTVVVNVATPAEPAFSIEKLQRAEEGEPLTRSPLTGKFGGTVEYEIVVKNTGNTALTFSNFTDANCEGIEGGPSKALAPGESATYTCEHTLTAAGSYENRAAVTATPPEGSPIAHTSNTVVVAVPAEPAFTIVKSQEIAGSGKGFTTFLLTGEVGQTIDYQIAVKDTGNTQLTFTSFKDANCEPIEGGPSKALALGESATYTCHHTITATDLASGSYSNTATATGTPPEGQGSPITRTSNTVVVRVPASSAPPGLPTTAAPSRPARTTTPQASVFARALDGPSLYGPRGCVRGNVVIAVKAAGVAFVTFYLDGRKLKVLATKAARGGKLTITLPSSKLHIGAHKVVAKIRMKPVAGSKTPVFYTRGLTLVRCGSLHRRP
jgi:uncharacterized repeat protein (TIGR01451 family)